MTVTGWTSTLLCASTLCGIAVPAVPFQQPRMPDSPTGRMAGALIELAGEMTYIVLANLDPPVASDAVARLMDIWRGK